MSRRGLQCGTNSQCAVDALKKCGLGSCSTRIGLSALAPVQGDCDISFTLVLASLIVKRPAISGRLLWAMEIAVRLIVFFAVVTFSSSQDTLSCGPDNLSCPRSDPDNQSLQCITASQLCDGSNLCSGGQDEGEHVSTIDCKEDWLPN